jgi:hypothetical protein
VSIGENWGLRGVFSEGKFLGCPNVIWFGICNEEVSGFHSGKLDGLIAGVLTGFHFIMASWGRVVFVEAPAVMRDTSFLGKLWEQQFL